VIQSSAGFRAGERLGRGQRDQITFEFQRQAGEQGLQEALASLDLASLKAIVRAYRLDPARISARWTAPERIIDLITEQARARLNHGRAFERV